MISSFSALRSPNRIRLSTLRKFVNLQTTLTGLDATYISLPLVALDSPGLLVPEWVTTTVQMDLSRSLCITSD
jgi:hypothetical protein